MLNLSDEEEDYEDETSHHIDSEAAFKSGATGSPVEIFGEDMSARSSLVQSSQDTTENLNTTEKANVIIGSRPDQPEAACPPEPRDVLLFEPPAGFGDSPEKPSLAILGHIKEKDDLAIDMPDVAPEEILIARQVVSNKPPVPAVKPKLQSAKSVPGPHFHEQKSTPAGPKDFSSSRSHSVTSSRDDSLDLKSLEKDSSCSTLTSRSSTPNTGKLRSSRSRSSSKERLLSKLAEANTALRTPMEEDEVTGNK